MVKGKDSPVLGVRTSERNEEMVEESSRVSLDLTPMCDLSTGAAGYSAYSCPQVRVAASSGLMFNLDYVRQMQNKRS